MIGISADAIADEIATAWDAETATRGSITPTPGSSDLTAADLVSYVQDWLVLNEEALDEEARGGRSLAG